MDLSKGSIKPFKGWLSNSLTRGKINGRTTWIRVFTHITHQSTNPQNTHPLRLCSEDELCCRLTFLKSPLISSLKWSWWQPDWFGVGRKEGKIRDGKREHCECPKEAKKSSTIESIRNRKFFLIGALVWRKDFTRKKTCWRQIREQMARSLQDHPFNV